MGCQPEAVQRVLVEWMTVSYGSRNTALGCDYSAQRLMHRDACKCDIA